MSRQSVAQPVIENWFDVLQAAPNGSGAKPGPVLKAPTEICARILWKFCGILCSSLPPELLFILAAHACPPPSVPLHSTFSLTGVQQRLAALRYAGNLHLPPVLQETRKARSSSRDSTVCRCRRSAQNSFGSPKSRGFSVSDVIALICKALGRVSSLLQRFLTLEHYVC
jgi:hypothetical protein